MTAERFALDIAGRRFSIDVADCHDLSIPLQFEGPQPSFFGAPAASSAALSAGDFTGDVRTGASCNCSTYSLTPHCNGTHTECVGHITRGRLSIRDIARDALIPAILLTVSPRTATTTHEQSSPAPHPGDLLITRDELEQAAQRHSLAGFRAVIVRTLPNSPDKQQRIYDTANPPPYFSSDAMKWMVEHDIDHLVVDVPSVDRASDQGLLTAHRLFWGMPPTVTDALHATRAHATITEFAYIDDGIDDGPYLLNLQVAPFASDAAPSRPFLMRLLPQ
ncbi:MAG: cyclase family protein [Steroidobacteraceae bacterium]